VVVNLFRGYQLHQREAALSHATAIELSDNSPLLQRWEKPQPPMTAASNRRPQDPQHKEPAMKERDRDLKASSAALSGPPRSNKESDEITTTRQPALNHQRNDQHSDQMRLGDVGAT